MSKVSQKITNVELARQLGYAPGSSEFKLARAGYVAALEEQRLDLWSVRRVGNSMRDCGKLRTFDDAEEWIKRHQDAYSRGYNYELARNSHDFLGAGKAVIIAEESRSVSSSLQDGLDSQEDERTPPSLSSEESLARHFNDVSPWDYF